MNSCGVNGKSYDFALAGFLIFKTVYPRMDARHFALFSVQLEESAKR